MMRKNFVVLLALTLPTVFYSCAPTAVGVYATAPEEYSSGDTLRIPPQKYYFSLEYPVSSLTGNGRSLVQEDAVNEFNVTIGSKVMVGDFVKRFKIEANEGDKVEFNLLKAIVERKIRDKKGETIYFLDTVKLVMESNVKSADYAGVYNLKVYFDGKLTRNLALTVEEKK